MVGLQLLAGEPGKVPVGDPGNGKEVRLSLVVEMPKRGWPRFEVFNPRKWGG